MNTFPVCSKTGLTMQSEFEKLVEKDVQVENHKQNMNKLHEIAKKTKKM